MPSRVFTILEYKYPDSPWIEYDRSQVKEWLIVQMGRLKQEHPGAQYRAVRA